MRPGQAGFREPGFRFAGQVDSSGGGGGSSNAVDISIADAGSYYASGNVEGALQEAFAAVNLRVKLADLASTAAGKGASLIGTNSADLLLLGVHPTVEQSLVSISDSVDQVYTDFANTANGEGASLIGIEDAGGHYTSTTVEGALTEAGVSTATNTTNIAANTTAIGLRPLTTDLASHTTGKGASTIGLEDAGAFYATKNVEAALAQLGPLLAAGTPTSLTATLTDAGTTTAPDLINIAHRSSGTPAANFGLTVARELDSSTRTRRRAVAEVTKWTTATDGAETASHTFQLRLSGTLTDTLTLSPTTSNFPVSGSNSAPTLTVGTPADLIGFYRSSSGELGIAAGGTRLARISSSGYYSDVFFAGPLSSASSPTYTVNGTTGGTGLYGLASGFAMSILNSDTFVATKGGAAFKFTALAPGSNNTASTEFVGFDVAMGRTSTWSTGAITTQREVLIRKPTYAFGSASTITTGATFAIEGAPVLGSNATAVAYAAGSVGVASTFVNTYSLWSQAGNVRFDAADAATNTVTELLSLRHTTSGTPAAGFGVSYTVDLQNAAGFVRRAAVDQVTFTNVTDGSEESQRAVSVLAAGTLQKVGGWGVNAGGYMLFVGDPANISGLRWSGSNVVQVYTGGVSRLDLSNSGATFSVSLNANGANTSINPTTQSSGSFTKFAFTPTTDTGTTASTEALDFDLNLSRTRTWATGALATQRAIRFKGPTYAFVGASTITSAATLAIESAPAAGANATITNSYSLWVQAGATRFDGNFGFQKTPVGVQNTTGTATGFTAGAGTAVNDQSTFTGGTGATAYRISDIVLALKNYGWLAA